MDPSIIIISDSDEENYNINSEPQKTLPKGALTVSHSTPPNSKVKRDYENKETKPRDSKYEKLQSTSQHTFKPSISILMSDDDSSKSENTENHTKFQISNSIKMNHNKERTLSRSPKITNEETRRSHSNESRCSKERKSLIRKLENELSRLEMRLEVAENYDLSLDDLNDSKSKYIQLHKLRERYRSTWSRYCSVTNFNQKTIFSKIKITSSSIPEVNKRMEEWISNFKQFPNFIDVQQQLEKIHAELYGLAYDATSCSHITAGSLSSLASAMFLEIGLQIVKSRKSYYKFYFESYLINDNNTVDPADVDNELRLKLSNNFNAFLTAMENIKKHFSEINSLDDTEINQDENLEHNSEIETDDDYSDLDNSSLSSLSDLSDNINSDIDNSHFNQFNSTSPAKLSLESDDDDDDDDIEPNSFDQLYVDRLLSQNCSNESLTSNNILQTTKSPMLIQKSSNLQHKSKTSINQDDDMLIPLVVDDNHSKQKIIFNDNKKPPEILDEHVNVTSKKMPLLTLSQSVVDSMIKNYHSNQTLSNKNLLKHQASKTKVFKLKPLTDKMIKLNGVKIENYLRPAINNSKLPKSLPNIEKNNNPLENNETNILETPNLQLETEKNVNISKNKPISSKGMNHNKISNDVSVTINHQPSSNILSNQHTDNSYSGISYLNSNNTSTTESLTETKYVALPIVHQTHNQISDTVLCVADSNESVIRNQVTSTIRPTITSNYGSKYTVLKYEKNSKFYITGSSTPYTPNFMPPIILTSTPQITVTHDNIPSKTNKHSSSNIKKPPLAIKIQSNTTKKPTTSINSNISTQSSLKSSSCSVSTNSNLTTNNKNDTSKLTPKKVKSVLKVKKRIEGISQFFNSKCVENLSSKDYAKLNQAFSLLEKVKKSNESPKSKKYVKKNSKTKRFKKDNFTQYKIPKTGERKRKLKPTNRIQPSKKPKL